MSNDTKLIGLFLIFLMIIGVSIALLLDFDKKDIDKKDIDMCKSYNMTAIHIHVALFCVNSDGVVYDPRFLKNK